MWLQIKANERASFEFKPMGELQPQPIRKRVSTDTRGPLHTYGQRYVLT